VPPAFGQSVHAGLTGAGHPGCEEPEQLAHDLAEDLRCGLDQGADVQAEEMDLVLVDQFPVGDRGFAAGHAIDDDLAGDPFCRRQARVEGGAAGRLQYQVSDRAPGQPQDFGGPRAVMPGRPRRNHGGTACVS
jgi:hypothetical protein